MLAILAEICKQRISEGYTYQGSLLPAPAPPHPANAMGSNFQGSLPGGLKHSIPAVPEVLPGGAPVLYALYATGWF